MLPFVTIRRRDSSLIDSPSGARSSAAITSKRGSVVPNSSRRRRRRARSISFVAASRRSHSRRCVRDGSCHHTTSAPATVSVRPVTAACAGSHSQATADATSSGRTNRPIGLSRRRARLAASPSRPVDATIPSTARSSRGDLGVARAHGVDGHAGRGELERQRAREPDERVLACAIGRDVGVAALAGGATRCSRSGPMPRSVIPGAKRAAEQERAGRVGLEHPPPEREVGARERRRLGGAGVVHEQIHGAGTRGEPLDRRPRRSRRRRPWRRRRAPLRAVRAGRRRARRA